MLPQSSLVIKKMEENGEKDKNKNGGGSGGVGETLKI